MTDFRLAQAARPLAGAPDPAGDLRGLGRCLATMLTGRQPAAGEPIALGPEVPAELAAVVARTAGDLESTYHAAADLGHDLDRFLAGVRPGAGPTAQPDPVPGHDRPALAADGSSSAGQLVPVAAASPPHRRIAAAVGAQPARRRRALTLAAGLVVVGAAAAVGLLDLQPPGPVTNHALVPASTAILATTTSQPTTSRAPTTTASPTTTRAGAASPPTTQQTTGQAVGSDQRVVPDVVGLHRQQVADVLAQTQLGVQLALIQVSDSAQVQRVVQQQPPAGHVLPAGSLVTVLVGTRRPTA